MNIMITMAAAHGNANDENLLVLARDVSRTYEGIAFVYVASTASGALGIAVEMTEDGIENGFTVDDVFQTVDKRADYYSDLNWHVTGRYETD